MPETRLITNSVDRSSSATRIASHPRHRQHTYCRDTRLHARVGLLCALMLALAGCQRDPDPKPASVASIDDSSAHAQAAKNKSADLSRAQLSTAEASIGADFADAQFLPVDEAFKLDLVPGEKGVELVWTIAPDYYLYKHKFKILARYTDAGAPQDLTASARFSAGLHKTDDYYGKVEVYYHQAVSQLSSTDQSRGEVVSLSVAYQGCAEAGLCYPVQTRTLALAPTR